MNKEHLGLSKSPWVTKGATISHKNACKEFDLTERELIEAMKSGKLQFRKSYAHGNPYFKFIRAEVEALARELQGDESVEEQERKHKLKQIEKEINKLKRKIATLERQKRELELEQDS